MLLALDTGMRLCPSKFVIPIQLSWRNIPLCWGHAKLDSTSPPPNPCSAYSGSFGKYSELPVIVLSHLLSHYDDSWRMVLFHSVTLHFDFPSCFNEPADFPDPCCDAFLHLRPFPVPGWQCNWFVHRLVILVHTADFKSAVELRIFCSYFVMALLVLLSSSCYLSLFNWFFGWRSVG